VQLTAFKGTASNCLAGSCIELPNPDKKNMNLVAAFSTSEPSSFPDCNHTFAEANLNDPHNFNIVDISVNDGYNAVIQIKHVATAGTPEVVAGPNAKGLYGNGEIAGVFPYGCNDCAPHSAQSGSFKSGGALFALCKADGSKPPNGVKSCSPSKPCDCPAPSEKVCNGDTCVCADQCHDCRSEQYVASGSCTVEPKPVCQFQFDGSTTDGVAEIGVKDI